MSVPSQNSYTDLIEFPNILEKDCMNFQLQRSSIRILSVNPHTKGLNFGRSFKIEGDPLLDKKRSMYKSLKTLNN